MAQNAPSRHTSGRQCSGGHTGFGVRRTVPPPAWATARTATRPGARPGARFRRLARRFGKGHEKKAAVAVAHTLLSIAWAVMRHDSDYVAGFRSARL